MSDFTIEHLAPESLTPHPLNFRRHPEIQAEALAGSLEEHGWLAAPILNKRTGNLLDGHARVEWAVGREATIPVRVVDVPEEQEQRILRSFDRIGALAREDEESLARLIDAVGDTDLERLLGELEAPVAEPDGSGGGEERQEEARQTLAERFGIPPFSVLDARQGYWQERKRAWIALGIESELGRGGNSLGESEGVNERHEHGTGNLGRHPNASPGGSPRPAARRAADGHTVRGDGKGKPFARTKGSGGPGELGEKYRSEDGWQETGLTFASGTPRPAEVSLKLQETSSGTSIFDPVLCELAYRWFCPDGGRVLDPFAGGSVRGIVAATLGRSYVGIDLRPEQLVANQIQADRLGLSPEWLEGDSRNLKELTAEPCDFVFSCPPYADLEVYSDDPRDLSTLAYADFLAAYREIIAQAVGLLKENRFACFVVGDVRDKQGFYRNFVADTGAAFGAAGAPLYNEAVLVTAVGSLPIRVGKQFGSYRKLGKTHQNVLVFYKGDPRKIKEIAADCQFGVLEESTDDGAPV